MKKKLSAAFLVLASLVCAAPVAIAETLTLYYDTKSKQVYTEAGPNRLPMQFTIPAAPAPGTAAPAAPVNAAAPASAPKGTTTTVTTSSPATTGPATVPVIVAASNAPAGTNPLKTWYDKFSVRGYTQFRYTSLEDDNDVKWFHPADRSVAPDQSFLIRRGRIILSGDATEHTFIYVQPELNAAPSDGDFSTQLRDLYADISVDAAKEFRFRVGQSKVPYGFVNLQSSQNRGPLERPDAFNSAVEGERDIGVFFYWAPADIRKRFATLVKEGLKGSGDYGVIGVGAYNGQGLNRSDSNDNPHVVARVSYPFQFSNGQYFEPGIQAYGGKFVPRTREITLEGSEEAFEPEFADNGIEDKRIGFSAILYPQPFGIETEWNIGRGPELSSDYLSIEERSLWGGYILANMKIDSESGTFFPFVRWQYFSGGRKFGRNAPEAKIDEWDFGLEYSPWPDVELTAMYSYTNSRTNTNDFPYEDLKNESRLGMQLQVNY